MNRPAAVLLAALLGWVANAQDKPKPADKPATAGPTATGFLLPNGWHLTPVGTHVEISDLPLNIHPLKDGTHALVTTNGFNRHELSLVNLKDGKVVTAEWARQSWFGLAVSTAEDKVWWSGGGNGYLHAFDVKAGKFERTSKKEINPAELKAADVLKLADELKANKVFKSGLLLDEARHVLYSLDVNGGTITAIGTTDKKETVGTLGGRPYDVVVGPRRALAVRLRLGAANKSSWWIPQTLQGAEAKIGGRRAPERRWPCTRRTGGCSWRARRAIRRQRHRHRPKGVVTETVIYTSLFPKAPAGQYARRAGHRRRPVTRRCTWRTRTTTASPSSTST